MQPQRMSIALCLSPPFWLVPHPLSPSTSPLTSPLVNSAAELVPWWRLLRPPSLRRLPLPRGKPRPRVRPVRACAAAWMLWGGRPKRTRRRTAVRASARWRPRCASSGRSRLGARPAPRRPRCSAPSRTLPPSRWSSAARRRCARSGARPPPPLPAWKVSAHRPPPQGPLRVLIGPPLTLSGLWRRASLRRCPDAAGPDVPPSLRAAGPASSARRLSLSAAGRALGRSRDPSPCPPGLLASPRRLRPEASPQRVPQVSASLFEDGPRALESWGARLGGAAGAAGAAGRASKTPGRGRPIAAAAAFFRSFTPGRQRPTVL